MINFPKWQLACSVAVVAFLPTPASAKAPPVSGPKCDVKALPANQVNSATSPYRASGCPDPRLEPKYIASGLYSRSRRLVYVALPGGTAGGQFMGPANGQGIVVLDADHDYQFVKRIPTRFTPASKVSEEVSGVAASVKNNLLYISTRGRLQAYDLETEKVAWENTYDGKCCERPELTPDETTLIVGSDVKDFWYVLDARTGDLKGKISTPDTNFAHNMGVSKDGKTAFLSGINVYLSVADIATMRVTKTIKFSDYVRPFVINHDASRIYANVNNLLGFEIADVATGKVIKRIEAPVETWKAKWADPTQDFYGHGVAPSHGIALTPDESEIWVVDNVNYKVLVYDNTGKWPVLKTSFDTGKAFFDAGVSADWITMGLDGKRAYLSSGDVVDVKTYKIVGKLLDEYGHAMHSEKFLELDFNNGRLVRAVSQFGEGDPAAVAQRRRAASISK